MASAVEEYLDHFDAIKRLAERIVDVADRLLEVSELLRGDPHKVLAAFSSGDWPTAEQLRVLMTELANAEDQLPLYWDKLPEKYRNAMPGKHPDMAGGVGYPDND